jgi:glutamine cyclotransferase
LAYISTENKKQMKTVLRFATLAMLLLAACKDKSDDTTETGAAPTDSVSTEVAAPKLIAYSVVAEYPHDTKAFTEGLQFVDGYLYESTGQYGSSELRKTDLKTGKVLEQKKLDNRYFGEGLTVLNGKIYQLTYKEKTGFVYDLKTMKQLQTFNFINEEAWGLTNDGTSLIYTDGGSKLYFMDPATMQVTKQVEITDQYGPVLEVNELEFINGYIYANQWTRDLILKIDPATGKVVAIADMRDLRQRVGIPATIPGDENSPEVMNGIAYDAAQNRIFITGKNWPKLLEVKLDN